MELVVRALDVGFGHLSLHGRIIRARQLCVCDLVGLRNAAEHYGIITTL